MKTSVPVKSFFEGLAALAIFIFSMVPAGHATAIQNPPGLPAASIHQMVKNVAWNELQAAEHPAHYYRYLNREVSPEGSRRPPRRCAPR